MAWWPLLSKLEVTNGSVNHKFLSLAAQGSLPFLESGDPALERCFFHVMRRQIWFVLWGPRPKPPFFQDQNFPWPFMILVHLKSPDHLLCRVPFSLGFSDVCSRLHWGYAFLAESHRSDVGRFCVSHQQACDAGRSHCCKVSLDYLVKVASARSLHFKITLFPFVINDYLEGRFFEIMQISCFCIILSAN